jgi:WD40 repeat protein
VWDVATGDVLLILRGHEGSLHSASFSPDGNRIVTSGSDSTTRLWDAHTGEQLFILPGHTAAVNSAVYSPDRQAIVTASDDGTARVYYATFDGVLDQAKRAVTRSLTNEERRMYMGE